MPVGEQYQLRKELDVTSTQLSSMSTPYVICAAVTGPSHIKRGLPCQDAFAHRFIGNNIVAIAVADGLGSMPLADVGAKLAVDSSLEFLAQALQTDPVSLESELMTTVFTNCILSVRTRLQEESIALECPVNHLATTLLITVIQNDQARVAHVGDGAVVAETDNGLLILSTPAPSEYVNVVTPITSDTWQEDFSISECLSCVNALAVFTDGCQPACLPKVQGEYQVFEGFFKPIFAFAKDVTDLTIAEEDLDSFLSSAKMTATSDDDKTLVLAVVRK